MGKVLRVMIVLILLLSAGALGLGIVLFTQREALKGRTQKTEKALADIAKNLQKKFDVESIKDYATMDGPLNQLAAEAQNTWNTLVQTSNDLEQTRTTLAETKTKLSETETALDQTKQQVEQLKTTVAEKETQISELNTKLASAEQEKSQLKTQLDDTNNQLAKTKEELNDTKDKLANTEQEVVSLKNELHICKGDTEPLRRGLTGKIMLVNPQWEFCVLDIGSDAGVVPNGVMLVHRDDKLVGKVKIGIVKRNMAVADIMGDWTQAPIQEGDSVVY
jgi:predicted RNase H-like nuclease (RuvC/YqgF family)